MRLFLSAQGAIQICLDEAMPENEFSAEIGSPLSLKCPVKLDERCYAKTDFLFMQRFSKNFQN